MSNFILGVAAEINTDYYTRFRSLTVDEGLPDNHITVIKQDDRGFIWIGTRNGLVRYDGVSFQNYLHGDDSCSISDNYITDIAFTSDQQLWVATRNGLNKYHRDKQCFEKVPFIASAGRGISHPYVRAIMPDKNDVLWVETLDGILQRLNLSTYDTKLFPHQRIIQEYYDYHTIYKDFEGLIWVGGRGMGPIYLDRKTQKFTTIKNDALDKSKKRDMDVAFYYEDSRNQFWMGATDGAYIYDKKNDNFTKILATSTFDMIEDEYQNLWMATGGGLYRYELNNKKMTRHQHFDSDPFSIVDNHVTCVFRDKSGNIWAGTKNGISIWFNTQNSVRQYRHLPHHSQSLSDDDVSCFLEDASGELWIGTMEGGLNRYQEESDDFEILNRQKGGLLSNRVSTLYQDAQKNIWIGYWQGLGFQKMSGNSHVLSSYALRPDSRKADWYNAFIDYDDSTLLAGIWGASGLHLFDKINEQFLPANWRPAYHPVNSPLYNISANGGVIWMDSGRDFIYNFNIDDKTFSAYRPGKFEEANRKLKVNSAKIPPFKKTKAIYSYGNTTLFMTDNGIFSKSINDKNFQVLSKIAFNAVIQITADSGLWFGNADGLSYLDDHSKLIQIENNSNPQLKGKEITALNYLNPNQLLVGTDKGLLIYNIQKKHFEQIDSLLSAHNEKELQTNKIIKLTDAEFIFTHQQGFTYYNSSEQTLTYYDLTNAFTQGLTSDLIHDAVSCSNIAGIWLATDQGLFHFSEDKNEFRKMKVLSTTSVFGIAKVDSALYLSTQSGLYAFDVINESIIPYNEPQEDALSSHLTSFIHRDSNGYIWSGTTDNGVNRMDQKTNKVAHFYQDHGYHGKSALSFCETMDQTIFIGGDSLNVFNRTTKQFEQPEFADQLPDEEILSILEDDKGLLYITTTHHIFRIDRINNQVQELNNKLDVKNITFTRGALRRSNGEIFIGSNKGYFSFHPERIKLQQPISKVQATSLNVIGQQIKTEIAYNERIVLPHDHNFFTIKFSGMDFSSNETSFQYQLKGVDKSWVSTTSTSVAYTKIAHGKYTFKVKRLGETDQNAFQFRIFIKPPFWSTWWFRTILGISIMLLVSYWWYQRLLKVRMVEKNLALKQRLLLSQMNPHFIFNTLTAIQGFIYKREPVAAGAYLSKFARLMRLYLQSMSSDIVALQKEIDSLRFYLELQRIRFDNKFTFNIDVDCDEDYAMVGFPSMMIQPFVENAVQHGMKTITENGLISCSLQLKQRTWVIFIEDNGPGILSNRNKSKKNRPSMSTKITLDRLAALSKQFKANFTLTISDLSVNSDTASGTRVEMTLPVMNIEGDQ